MVKSDKYVKILLNSGWKLPKSVWDSLDDYQKEFLMLEFTGMKTLDYYKRRLMAIDFCNKKHILDAACGMGQWSIALSELNKEVTGIDLSEIRIKVAQRLAKEHNSNSHFYIGRLENLPFADSTFDAVFCYGAFMFTNMPQTLKEFVRVLKPEGKIYINANSWGWYINLLINRGIKKKNLQLIKSTLQMILRAFLFKNSNIVVSERYLRKLFNSLNVKILHLDTEGGICLFDDKSLSPPPAYQSKIYGVRSIIEILARS